VRYEIEIKRFAQLKESGAAIVIGDGRVFVDNEIIAHIQSARTGIFRGITYTDYPKRSRNSIGGTIKERGITADG
jgi:3-hydroxyacyl-[acyl-carrier protein] dehydratase/trans-2-decenoyl-[acyl-carrier protein] isomerase